MKRFKRIKKKLFISMICAMCFVATGLLCACAGKGSVNNDPADAATNDGVEADPSSSQVTDGSQAGVDMEGLEGEWVLVYTLFHSEYGDGEKYDSCTMATDEYASTSKMIISKNDGKYLADYKYNAYESNYLLCGNELNYSEEAAYDECENKDWSFTFTDPFGEDDVPDIRFTMTDKDTLIGAREYFDEYEDSDYYSLSRDVYIRSTDPRLADEENLRYFETVRVSDALELLNSLQNNRKIVLEAGTYDFSKINDYEMNNERVSKEWGRYIISNVYNLCIEAAEGAEVMLSVDDPYSPVIDFDTCGNITVRGVTAGHNVEPGYCSGSVFEFDNCSGMKVEKCNLFGSGTYGISAMNCSNLEVNDTDIYECTYGLLDLNSVYSAVFKNCILRDSSDMSMICLYSSSGIMFEDCEFKNNRIDPEYSTCYFVEMTDYSDVTFNRCTFKDNQYNVFANSKAKMNACTVSDNGDMSNVEADIEEAASELRQRYKEACEEQKQIDLKFEAGNMDQPAMNQTAFEEYNLWDKLINDVWAYLKNTLDEDTMESLTEEQMIWIEEKEDSAKSAAAGYEGGTMQPMVEYQDAARSTKERTEYLLDRYVY